MSTRTTNTIERSGCIEDRTFTTAHDGELHQVPGADLFFTIARDIVRAADPSENTDTTLSESVLSDVAQLASDYTVHNDEHNDTSHSGCGFAAQLTAIVQDCVDNQADVIHGAHITKQDERRSADLISGLSKLINKGYFDTVGEALVQAAHDAGATMVTYIGEHTASSITADGSDDTTYDSAEANDDSTDSSPAFNLDTNHARNRAEMFGVHPNDGEIIARLLATSTVRILSGHTITELTEL